VKKGDDDDEQNSGDKVQEQMNEELKEQEEVCLIVEEQSLEKMFPSEEEYLLQKVELRLEEGKVDTTSQEKSLTWEEESKQKDANHDETSLVEEKEKEV